MIADYCSSNRELVGARLKKVKELTAIHEQMQNKNPNMKPNQTDWAVDPTKAIVIECDRRAAKRVKLLLCQGFNRDQNRIGDYQFRIVPEQSMMRGGSRSAINRTKMLKKHISVRCSVTSIISSDILDLDVEVTLENGTKTTGRKIFKDIKYPAHCEDDSNTQKLFFSMDRAMNGRNAGSGAYVFCAYLDRATEAEAMVDVLAAYVIEFVDRKAATKIFTPEAMKEAEDITFLGDDAGNWNGQWVSTDDLEFEEMINEDMGAKLQVEGTDMVQSDTRRAEADDEVFLREDEASVVSNKTAFGLVSTAPRQQGTAASAEIAASQAAPVNAGVVEGGGTAA